MHAATQLCCHFQKVKCNSPARYVSAADAGKYECQVSTQPKMSKTYSLNVVGEQF